MVDTRPDLSSYSRVSYIRELYGKVPEAIDAMEQAVEAGSPNAENTNWCRVQLGQLYWQEGDLAAAERQYQQVLTYYPQFMYALAAMGQLRAAEGKLDEAAAYYQQAINIVPLPQYVTALGDIYAKQGKTEEARKQYDLFDFIAKTNAVNGVNFDVEKAAFLADHDRDLPLALTLAQRVGATRTDIHTQDTLAWALYKNGQYDAAWAAMSQALRLGTRDALLHFHAGMIAGKRGDTAAARTHLEQALALNPQFHIFHADTARAELARLGK
jgi:tetratricopeptide (TPR) repeat protein